MGNLKDNCFISFGMGNGKTLLCVAIAIIFAKLRGVPVFIIGKNAHLVLRDSKKFEQLILSMGLKTNTNQYSREPGVYYYTQKDLETASSNADFSKVWRQSVAVLDENDWLMFEGPVEQMEKMMKLFG
jgi:preprotein translocase subunit SecA